MISNCIIENSYAQYGAIFYIIENYKSFVFIEKCELKNNIGDVSLFDIGEAYINISDTLITNNTNSLFSLISSTFILVNSTILNQLCINTVAGCLISGIEDSIILINITKFYNISSELEEGNIYLENSSLNMELTNMNIINTKKKQGSCFSIYSSSTLNLFTSNFSKYNFNCLYSLQSQIKILGSKFNNSNYSEKLAEFNNFGTIYCSECKDILISDSYFIKNSYIADGSSLFIISKKRNALGYIKIDNCLFVGNEAGEKGTIYIYNQNFSIKYSKFENNTAKSGGAIFVDNDGNFLDK